MTDLQDFEIHVRMRDTDTGKGAEVFTDQLPEYGSWEGGGIASYPLIPHDEFEADALLFGIYQALTSVAQCLIKDIPQDKIDAWEAL